MEDLLLSGSCGVHPPEVAADLIRNTVGERDVKAINPDQMQLDALICIFVS